MSSSILGYPFPQVTNWEKEYEEERFGAGSDEWGHLLATLKYLEALPSERDDDLVLITDVHDAWFQLKPEVLIQRYRKTNIEAEKRARKRLGKVAEERELKQDLVFAAQKQCPAGSKEDVSCYAAPESSLPRSTYGPTKYDAEHDLPVEVGSRPRYLHSGMAMGSAASMRRVFKSAYNKWQKNPSAYRRRQEVFADIFGGQEYFRELLRVQRLTSFSRWWSGETSFVNSHTMPESMRGEEEKSFEYGISLDYSGSLVQVVASAENNADWIRYSDRNTISTAATAFNITDFAPKSIQRDIEYSRPPFWSLAPVFNEPDLPKEMFWETLPLYTNLWTGTTPVVILQPRNTDPQHIQTQWKQMWYQPYLRAQLDTLAHEPVYPIASEKIIAKSSNMKDKNGQEKTWWSSVVTTPADKEREGYGFLVKGEDWKRWTDVCREEDQAEIFGDGKGKWIDPKVYPPYGDLI